MKPGKQTDIVQEFGCSRTAISKLVKAKDYRIIYTPAGSIDIDATVKALKDSGFGKRSNPIKKRNGTKKIAVIKEDEILEDEDLLKEGPLLLTDSRGLIEKRKSFHQAEKVRIENEEKLGKLIDVEEVGEKSFTLWRQVRDGIQAIKDRCSVKIMAAQTVHDVEQILDDETHNILSSIVDGYENIDDSALKKKLVLNLTR